MQADPIGRAWRLTHFDRDDAVPEEIMYAESRFLDALAHVVRYDLAGERLALTSPREAGRQTLLFAPAGAGS